MVLVLVLTNGILISFGIGLLFHLGFPRIMAFLSQIFKCWNDRSVVIMLDGKNQLFSSMLWIEPKVSHSIGAYEHFPYNHNFIAVTLYYSISQSTFALQYYEPRYNLV